MRDILVECIDFSGWPSVLQKRSGSRTSVSDPFDSQFLNSITVENIKSSFRPWIIKCVDKCVFKELTFEEQAIVFNRLLMVHCFEVFLHSKYLTKQSMFDCEVVLPALCSLIDRSIENGAKSFVVGLSQLSQLSSLSEIMESSEENLFMELLKCRNDLSVDEFDDETNYLIFDEDLVSEFIEPSKCKPYDISLFGPPSPASAVYPLMMGRAKALQSLEKDGGSDTVWPVFCYPLAEICSEDTFKNIVKILREPSLSAGGTVHLIINCEHAGFEDARKSMESSSKLIKRLADMVKAPVIHVKAEEVDSVVYVMNMVSDFRANHKRDIFVNLMGSSRPTPNKNVALAGFIKEFIVGGKDPLVSLYSKELIANKVLSRMEFQDRKEGYLRKMVEHTNPKSGQGKKSSILEKRVKEPFTGADTDSINQMIASLDKHSSKAAANEPTLMEHGRESIGADALPFSFNPVLKESTFAHELNWKKCVSLAYASLIQEGWNIHISRIAPGPASPIVNPRILVPFNPCPGDFKLTETDVAPFALAGFQIGFSSANDNILAVWEVPEDMEPSVLHDVASKYYGVPKVDDVLTTNVIFIAPTYFNVPSSEATHAKVSSQMSQVLKVCEDCDNLTSFNDQLYNCNVVVASVSTPANLFHLIRRHARSPLPKPLIVFIPNEVCGTSSADELTGDTCFRPYIGDASIFDMDTKNVILCTGRIQHELKRERACRHLNRKIAIGHIEQLCPFPYNNLIQDMERFPNAKIWWAQEEEPGDGCWNYVESRLLGLFGEERIVRFTGHFNPCSPLRPAPTLSERVNSILDVITDS